MNSKAPGRPLCSLQRPSTAWAWWLACPVTRGSAFARGKAWTVPLPDAGLATDGVVLCNQVRTVDWKARRAQFVEAVSPDLIGDVLARVATLID